MQHRWPDHARAPSQGRVLSLEFYEDVAEDAAKVVAVNVPVSIGLGDFSGCLVTNEWSPLDPGAVEHKHYRPNVGLVLIEKLGGKTEVVEAIDLVCRRPSQRTRAAEERRPRAAFPLFR